MKGKLRSIDQRSIEKRLITKSHDLAVISLKKENLGRLFSERRSILDSIMDMPCQPPKPHFLVFGASSILDKFRDKESSRISFYPRPGVDKLAVDFKDDVLDQMSRHASSGCENTYYNKTTY